ncbi:MAG: hypothetical protein JO215_06210 [Ktedonobacteraceae bacterium]|nr:hypothetical protein [Ktedonobacteraceae bacterium]MBV9614176.1 hypothetical protein [Ktedonobacteraceae bacterium]MBV9713426.1 hypothetical protein [Ktedonobacteraceae bacterium]
MGDNKKDIREDEQNAWQEAVEVIDELYAEELSEQHDMANPNGGTLSSISTVATSGTASSAGTISTGATIG